MRIDFETIRRSLKQKPRKAPMPPRIDYFQASPHLGRKFAELNQLINASPSLKDIGHLAALRASQINGCPFCVDFHVKEGRLQGEGELRLHHVLIWRESPLFSEKERAAFAWTEALTRLEGQDVPDATFDAARSLFSDQELADLSFLIFFVNGWNRLGIAFKTVPGSADKLFGLDRAEMR
jgi:AhpD family alkylhydroperoxidase